MPVKGKEKPISNALFHKKNLPLIVAKFSFSKLNLCKEFFIS